MIYIKEIDRCTLLLLSFQRQYFTLLRYRAGMKPNIDEILTNSQNGQPYDGNLLAIFYFEHWDNLNVLMKKRPSEMKTWCIRWLPKVAKELNIKFEKEWHEV